MISIAILANIINALGVAGLLLGHGIIARGNHRRGVQISSAGALIVAAGSSLIGSWPIVALNLSWFVFGWVGLSRQTEKTSATEMHGIRYALGLALLSATGFIFWAQDNTSTPAWIASAVYLISFGLLSFHRINKNQYLLACLLSLTCINKAILWYLPMSLWVLSSAWQGSHRHSWRYWHQKVIKEVPKSGPEVDF